MNQFEENAKTMIEEKNKMEIEKSYSILKKEEMALMNQNLLLKFNDIQNRNNLLEKQAELNKNIHLSNLLNIEKKNILDNIDVYINNQIQLFYNKINFAQERIRKIENIIKIHNEKKTYEKIQKFEEKIKTLEEKNELLSLKFNSECCSLRNDLNKQNEITERKNTSIIERETVIYKLQTENESYANLISSSNKKLIKFKEDHEKKIADLYLRIENYIKELQNANHQKEEIIQKFDIERDRIKGINEIKSIHGQIKGVVRKVK